MPNWKKLIVSGSAAELSTLKLTGLSGQSDETTSLMINGSNVIGTRDLGSNAFTSTTIPTNNNQLTNGAGYTTNTGTVDTSGTPADNDFAKFTDANTIEGRSIAETKSDLSLNNVENKSSATIRGEIVSGDIPNNAADTSGNAATATKLAAAVNIAGVAFDGSEAISLNNSNITNGAGYTTNTGDITGVTAGDGLTGGGSSGGVTVDVDYAGTDNIILTATAYTDTIDTGDYILVSDSSNNVRYNTVSNLPFTNNSGDITQVNITAGDGLTGDVNTTSGAHTQTIDVDSTVVRTSGTQTVGGSKTFSSETTFTAGIQLNDSDVITLGTGNDYEILDDGTDTLFRGRRHEGKLYFQMENDGGTLQNAIILGSSGSAKDVGVELRYNNVARVWTTSGGTAIKTPSIIGISAQNDETTALMINGSNVVGTRELGSNAFTSTTIGTTSNALTVDNTTIQLNSGTTFNGSAARTISAKTAAISDGGTALATADQIHTFVTSFGYTTNTGDITGVTAGTGLSGGGSSGGVTLALDLSELSEVTPASGDSFATLDSDGSTEQRTTVDALATLLAGSGLSASEGVLSVTETGDISGVTAGDGLTGGGSSGAVTVAVGAGNLIDVQANQVDVDLTELTDMTQAWDNDADEFVVLDGGSAQKRKLSSEIFGSNAFNSTAFTTNTGTVTSVTINTSAGLDGSGTITTSGTVNLRLDLSELTDMTADVNGEEDELILLDNGAERRKLINEIKLSQFNNDSGFTTNTGDITGVTAGVGLSGGGSSGGVTLTLDLSELSEVTPASGDALATLDSDGSTEQLTTVDALATLFAGTGLSASEGVLSVDTLNQDTSGNAATATALATAREIAGVNFDGTANIALNNSNITNGAGYTTNTGTVDTSGTPVDNDYAKFTDANTIEGRSAAEVKTDLSLNNVENTAISTFAGTSNITTVGTIGTGTWQGTAIASAYLDSDTAHLSGTQTFSGAKTFSSNPIVPSIKVEADGGIIDSEGVQAISIDDSANVLIGNGLLTVEGTGTSEFTSHLKAHCLGIGTNPSGTQGEIRATNDITAYYSSDIRLKENIHSLKGTLEKLDSIRAVSYDWKELTEEERKTVHSHTGSDIGVIAQEVEEVFPDLVEDRPNGYKAVNYEKLSAVLLSAVKELKQEVEELKQKIK